MEPDNTPAPPATPMPPADEPAPAPEPSARAAAQIERVLARDAIAQQAAAHAATEDEKRKALEGALVVYFPQRAGSASRSAKVSVVHNSECCDLVDAEDGQPYASVIRGGCRDKAKGSPHTFSV